MKQNLIKVFKNLPDGKEVELLADATQLEALRQHPDFKVPETKDSNKKNQIPEGEEVV
ncbi:hypothetical protein CH379_018480 [Leptospira ellisii]|uniref:Uncharacterized protein n=1 Tax=Leptospira ellisii TaxID=2023197 RepID=A0AAE4QR05_9LEPT|nr:hypothetical protein [Leptospira ellisii]MDV6237624.1 hypothetical protein [Leptospira ellisii]